MAGDTRGPDPGWEITPEVIEQIKEMAGVMTVKEIRNCLGVCKSTWYKRVNEKPETKELIKSIVKKGKPKKKLLAVNTLFKAMKKGGKEGVTAAIFYLKTQEFWSENKKLELTIPRLPELPTSLGTDPIEASRTYQKIMGGS